MVDKYLLIFEGNELRGAPEWKDEWQSEVDAGVLEVIEHRDGHFWYRRPSEPEQPNWEIL